MTSLTETLLLIAAQIKCDAQELIAYAHQDTLGGYHWNPALATFPQGSCYGVEGQTLYALVRYLKPAKVVEIGGWAGCSSAHLAAAVKANGFGEVISIDNEIGGMAHGNLLPAHLQQYVTLVRANGEDWLAEQEDQSVGLIFEDATHSTELVALLSCLALRKLQPGGILANHDAGHDQAIVGGGQIIGSSVGREVRDGLAQANVYFNVYLAEPSDCGLSISVAPGEWQVAPEETEAEVPTDFGIAPIESAPPAKIKKPRKPRIAKA